MDNTLNRKTAYSSWDKGQPDNLGKAQHCAFTNFQSRLGRWDDVQCDASIQVMCEESGKGIVIPVPFRYSLWDVFDLYEAGGWSTNLPIRSPLNLNIRVL